MGWYGRHVSPRLLCWACSTPGITQVRRRVVPLASGRVLELGAGGGLNLPFYRREAITELHGLDPSPELSLRAMRAAAVLGWPLRMHAGVAEALPFGDAEFDTVVCTFTLCSVQSPDAALDEVRRVLRPGGRLLFAEHGLAPDPAVARWQQRVDPLWERLAGGCHLARHAPSAIRSAGFSLTLEESYAAGVPRLAAWCSVGAATIAS